MSTTTVKSRTLRLWKSPITSDLIVAQAIGLSEVRLDSRMIYRLEGRPQEQGRSVVARAGEFGEENADIMAAPFNCVRAARIWWWRLDGGRPGFSTSPTSLTADYIGRRTPGPNQSR